MDCYVWLGIGILVFFFFRKWIQGPRFTRSIRIPGKVVLITGGNAGVGKATAIEMLRRGAEVIIACRSLERAKTAREEIVAAAGGCTDIAVMKLDLASFKSIREFVEQFKAHYQRLDILINNAAVMTYDRGLTADGLETQIGVNHFGHFLLTNLLVDELHRAAPSRVINISSLAHLGAELDKDDLMSDKGYTMIGTYRKSKLANVLFTKELARRMAPLGITSYSLHPGGNWEWVFLMGL